MRVLVISDSHGNYEHALKAHELAGPVDHIVHLGDGAEDARLIEQLLEVPVLRVAGNCDLDPSLPVELVVQLGACRTLVTHGHRYHAKSGLRQLLDKGREIDAQVVLYGHTHRPDVHTESGILLVNPGPLKHGYEKSYAILTVDGEALRAEIFGLH